MGVHFASTKFILNHGNNTQIPQIVSTSIITNTVGWTKIEGTFIADGTEKYLYIGNFKDDYNTQYIDNSNNNKYGDDAYYYIDDVYVSEVGANLKVNAGENKCNNLKQGVQLGGAPTASGGSGSYTYTWSPSNSLNFANVPNPIANPSINTTYKLTVEDINGCVEYDEVKVFIDPIQIDFNIKEFDKYDNFEDHVVEFNSACLNCSKVIWNFGDGTTYTSNYTNETVYHRYAKPGYYFVKTFYDNECDVQGARKEIYIAPNSNSTDNQTKINYRTYQSIYTNTFNNPYSNSIDIVISKQMAPINNPIVWSTVGTKFEIKGELVIESGASLEIKDITIMFGPLGKIIVKPGGYLKLNGCTLRGFKGTLNSDEFMWFGIEVQGMYDYDNPLIYIPGNLTMMNNATIKDAHVGIIVGIVVNQPINAPLNNSDFIYNAHGKGCGGGIIQVSNSNFINNGTSIRFYGQEYFGYNRSVIKNCNFTSSSWGLKDPYYYSLNENYSDLKGHNPHILGSNPNIVYPIGHSSQGIDAINIKGVEISNNSFSGINHPITLSNCRAVKVKSNNFENTPLAIYINGVFDYYSNNTIYSNNFQPLVQKCIKTSGSNGDNIIGNKIREINNPSQLVYSTDGPAIELQSSNFVVRDNIIKNYGTAINVIGDPIKSNYGFIGNKIRGNFIEANSNFPYITFEGNNRKITMKCNEFKYISNSNNSSKYVWQISGTFGNQGTPYNTDPLNPNFTPAGNIFDFNSIYPVRKFANFQQSGPSYYYRHIDDFCTPTQSKTNLINIQDNKVNYVNYATSCLLPVIANPVPVKLHINSLRAISNSFKNELINTKNNLNQNNTEALISSINYTENLNVIIPTLVNNSPLSEEVLSLILNSPKSITDENFINLMRVNLPIYDNLNSIFYSKLNGLPPDIKYELTDIIGYNPYIRTPKAIEIDIDNNEKEKFFYLTNYMELMGQIDSLENALDFLYDDASIDITKIQFGDAFMQGKYQLANAYKEKIDVIDQGVQNFIDYSSFIFRIKSSNRSFWELDSLEKQYLYSFASICPQTYESKQAENLIKVYFGDTINHCNANYGKANNTIIKNDVFNHKNNLGIGYPNPVSSIFYIPYNIDYSVDASIELFDINGTLLSKNMLNSIKGILVLNLENLPYGIYFYKLLVDGKLIDVEKLVKIR